MEFRQLGQSGIQVSAISFGALFTFGKTVDVDTAVTKMRVVYEAGVNFFDNAENYGHGETEAVMGKALKKTVPRCLVWVN